MQQEEDREEVGYRFTHYVHLMPTRYVLPAEFQPASLVTTQQMDSPDGRKEAIAYIKTVFEEDCLLGRSAIVRLDSASK